MMLNIVVFFFISTVVVSSYPTFPQYLAQFHKNYSADEYAKRQQIYNERINNFSAITDFIPGINNMTDWTSEEIKALLNFGGAPDASNVSSPPVRSSRLGNPTSLDWRANQYITRVKDQGGCGSCWAFAAIAQVQSYLVQKNKTDNTVDLSEQKVLQCTPNSDCNGGSIKQALKSISKSVPDERTYPYNSGYSYSGICSAGGIDTNYEVFEYTFVSDSELINMLQQGPIAVGISADRWEYYGSGVLSCNSNAQLNHAVLAVGYTTTSIIIKNSWGSSWGMSGYAYITRNPSRNCLIGVLAYTIKWQSKIIVSLISILIFLGIMM